jgi:hypothetical protein
VEQTVTAHEALTKTNTTNAHPLHAPEAEVLSASSCLAPPLFGPSPSENIMPVMASQTIQSNSKYSTYSTATGTCLDLVGQTDAPGNGCGMVAATAPMAPAKKIGKMRPGTTNTARCDCSYPFARISSLFLIPGVYVHRIGVRKIQGEPPPSSRRTSIICRPIF